jgi:penicillin-binding protein 1A
MNTKSQGLLIPRFWNFLFTGVVFSMLFFLMVSFGLFGTLPDIKELENPNSALASEVLSEDGVVLGKYYRQNRTNISFKDISPSVREALVATEDVRFFTHSGIDFRGLLRAVVFMGSEGGASTISQQLAKNLFSDKPKMKITRVLQKFKEWVIAVQLERRYTKEEIMAMYLNTVPFSGHSFGIKAAAGEFFNKAPSELNTAEAAVLVGMLKAPSAYNPKRNPERSQKRRNVVMSQMVKAGFLREGTFDTLKSQGIQLDYQPAGEEGMAPYFRDVLAKDLEPWCEEHGYDLYKSGLRIYTTINSKMQRYAEEAAVRQMKDNQANFNKGWGKDQPWRYIENYKVIPGYIEKELKRTERYVSLSKKYDGDEASILTELKKPVRMTVFSWRGDIDTTMSPYDSMAYAKRFLHCGFIAIDPATAEVRAWVGGINHKFFQYDHVNKKASRQIGSTFKPFVYASAIDINKTSPCATFPREYTTFYGYGKPWTPRNSDGSSGGNLTMAQGLSRSDNLITAQIMKSLGPEAPETIIKMAERMGVEKGRIPAVPSICLGTHELSPFEMAGAFTTFVNRGLWIEPTYLTRIEDKNGNVLAEFTEKKHDQILSEEKAYLTYRMLEGVVNHGTAARLRYRYGLQGSLGGKTGTTQGNADGWYMGVSTDLVCAAWVGGDDPSIRFRTMAAGQGASSALPIYAYFMQRVMADPSLGVTCPPLGPPSGPQTILSDCGPPEANDYAEGNELDEYGQ